MPMFHICPEILAETLEQTLNSFIHEHFPQTYLIELAHLKWPAADVLAYVHVYLLANSLSGLIWSDLQRPSADNTGR